eukprot:2955799-Prymnesium_polylepis.1
MRVRGHVTRARSFNHEFGNETVTPVTLLRLAPGPGRGPCPRGGGAPGPGASGQRQRRPRPRAISCGRPRHTGHCRAPRTGPAAVNGPWRGRMRDREGRTGSGPGTRGSWCRGVG